MEPPKPPLLEGVFPCADGPAVIASEVTSFMDKPRVTSMFLPLLLLFMRPDQLLFASREMIQWGSKSL